MLYLIHGDHGEASRKKLTDLKHGSESREIREISGKKLDGTSLTQALESSSMFGGDVFVVIEGFLTHAKKREKTFARTLEQLVRAAKTIDVILYEEKELDKATIAKVGATATVFLCKTPVVIFQFLDTLKPGSAAYAIPLFHQVIASEPVEVVYALLLRRVRQLIQISDGITPDKMQSWQATRLTSQSRHFTMDKLVAMHEQLLKIDIAVKTGSSPFTLAQHIEQFLISL